MKIFQYIFSLILWFLFWLTAFVSIVLALLISLILPRRFWNGMVRGVCRLLSTIVLLFPKVTSVPENVPFPCVYVANHVSFFDLFLCGCTLPGYPRGMELKSHFTKPIYGWFVSRFGELPIDKGSPSKLRRSFMQAADILKRGERSILIMPEGTRTRTGELGRFGGGAFFLARTANVPIVPVIFDNLFEHNNAKSLIIKSGRIRMRILDPIYPADFETEQALGEFTRETMMKAMKCL